MDKPDSDQPPWFHRMDKEGETPLSRSFKTSYPYLVNLLLSQECSCADNLAGTSGSSPNGNAYWGMGAAVKNLMAGKSSASKHTDFIKTVCEGTKEDVRELVEQGEDVDQTDENGLTALHWTALSGQAEVAEYLLDNGADVNPPLPGSRLSPTGIALLMGYQDLFELLTVRGGKPN